MKRNEIVPPCPHGHQTAKIAGEFSVAWREKSCCSFVNLVSSPI
jgi:hypothetical protein